MKSDENVEIDVTSLMVRMEQHSMHAGVLPKRVFEPQDTSASCFRGFDADSISIPRSGATRNEIVRKSEYSLGDFLKYTDKEFISNAYLGLLGRRADRAGLERGLADLRTGAATRVDILGRLRFSKEGRARGVAVRGLLSSFAIRRVFRVPYVGPALAEIYYLLQLPRIVRNLVQVEASVNANRTFVLSKLDHLAQSAEFTVRRYVTGAVKNAALVRSQLLDTNERLSQTQGAMSNMQRAVDGLRADLANAQGQLAQAKGEIARSSEELFKIRSELTQAKTELGRLNECVIQNRAVMLASGESIRQENLDGMNLVRESISKQQRDLLDQKRNVARLLEEAEKQGFHSVELSGGLSSEQSRLLDAFYADFEDRFRGERQDIKDRLGVYLPIVKAAAGMGGGGTVLDIGCGRGEWLEVLSEHGLAGKGIDVNRIMVAQCLESSLDAVEGDGLEYLKSLDANSVCAITGFHIIEHLELPILIALIDETLRVLVPGGVAIFETPNPENLLVGSCNFYYDPTHRNPLPPEPTRFILESRGFDRVEILRLHPMPFDEKQEVDTLPLLLKHLLTAPQDYALIGHKA